MSNSPTASFDIRFLDTKTEDPSDHPWRIRYTINDQVVPFDGHWHHVKIPLTWFTEQGAWDNNQWYNPVGAFDWSKIDRFELAAEHKTLTNTFLTFDNILITDSLQTEFPSVPVKKSFIRIWPNPARQSVQIIYDGCNQGNAFISIYSLSGELVRTWSLKLSTGSIAAQWDLTDQKRNRVKQGVYFCSLISPTFCQTEKIIVLP
jgi:endoglucanase